MKPDDTADWAPPARILIRTDDPAAARRWTEALAGPKFAVWTEPDGLPELDVALTDQASAGPVEGWATSIGVIAVGSTAEADVTLPADASGREIRLTCRLLAEIVRLRRSREAAARHRQQLEEAVHADPLTGLPNRRAWDRTLKQRLAGSASARPSAVGPFALAMVDLDHFKTVNDRRGHVVGDQVLRAAGEALRAGLRRDDFLARLGGDEFAILLEGIDPGLVGQVLDRVRRAIPQAVAELGQEPVTASVGFCLPTGPGQTPEQLLARASEALGTAKRLGRDRVVGPKDAEPSAPLGRQD